MPSQRVKPNAASPHPGAAPGDGGGPRPMPPGNPLRTEYGRRSGWTLPQDRRDSPNRPTSHDESGRCVPPHRGSRHALKSPHPRSYGSSSSRILRLTALLVWKGYSPECLTPRCREAAPPTSTPPPRDPGLSYLCRWLPHEYELAGP